MQTSGALPSEIAYTARVFDKEKYIAEMRELVDESVRRMKREKPKFRIYTASISTDPDSQISSISFDSKTNSSRRLEEGSASKEQKRCERPGDFRLRRFAELENASFPKGWATSTEGECWKELEPALLSIAKYAFAKFLKLNIEREFELGINGRDEEYGRRRKRR